jgi:hypothetical protein
MAIQHYRHLWRGVTEGFFTFWWRAIRHDSYVVVTVAEARVSALVPDRFIEQHTWPQVVSVAPMDGRLQFTVLYTGLGLSFGSISSLDLWTDITVFDPNDPSGTN